MKRTDITVVMETRIRNGMKWRRYRTPDGAFATTYEVPASVIGAIGAARLREELDRAQRTLRRKSRNAKALALLASGWKVEAVANEVGLCDSQVRRLRQKRSAGALK